MLQTIHSWILTNYLNRLSVKLYIFTHILRYKIISLLQTKKQNAEKHQDSA